MKIILKQYCIIKLYNYIFVIYDNLLLYFLTYVGQRPNISNIK